MTHEEGPCATAGSSPIARDCKFPANGLLNWRSRCLRYLGRLSPDDSSERARFLRRSLRFIDVLASDHQAISGCGCFYRIRMARIAAEAQRREAEQTGTAHAR